MTHLTSLLTALALMTAGPALATDVRGNSDAPLRRTAVTINPLALVGGAADLQVEMRQTTGTALAIRAGFGSPDRTDWMWGSFNLGAAWKFYPDHRALTGFSWGPGAALAFGRGRSHDFAVGPTIEAGAQIVVDGGAALGIGGGLAWYFGTGDAYPPGALVPFARIALGYAWR